VVIERRLEPVRAGPDHLRGSDPASFDLGKALDRQHGRPRGSRREFTIHRNSLLLFERHGAPHIRPGDRVLELGPDGSPSSYQRAIDVEVECWHTVDFATGMPVTYELDDPYVFPVDDDAYDVIVSGQVVEHVPRLWRWMGEVARVCRPGGTVITVAPVSWPYHEAPQDCWRIYPEGLKALYEDVGLEVVFADWDSLETEGLRRRLPRALAGKRGWSRLASLLLLFHERLWSPYEGAFDTIAIGRRPAKD